MDPLYPSSPPDRGARSRASQVTLAPARSQGLCTGTGLTRTVALERLPSLQSKAFPCGLHRLLGPTPRCYLCAHHRDKLSVTNGLRVWVGAGASGKRRARLRETESPRNLPVLGGGCQQKRGDAQGARGYAVPAWACKEERGAGGTSAQALRGAGGLGRRLPPSYRARARVRHRAGAGGAGRGWRVRACAQACPRRNAAVPTLGGAGGGTTPARKNGERSPSLWNPPLPGGRRRAPHPAAGRRPGRGQRLPRPRRPPPGRRSPSRRPQP